jgi:hypothetical protein
MVMQCCLVIRSCPDGYSAGMSGQKTISGLDREIKEKTLLAEQNQQILNDIKS